MPPWLITEGLNKLNWAEKSLKRFHQWQLQIISRSISLLPTTHHSYRDWIKCHILDFIWNQSLIMCCMWEKNVPLMNCAPADNLINIHAIILRMTTLLMEGSKNFCCFAPQWENPLRKASSQHCSFNLGSKTSHTIWIKDFWDLCNILPGWLELMLKF